MLVEGRLCVAVDVGLGHGMSICFFVVILDLIQELFRLQGFGWNGVTVDAGMLKQVQHDGAGAGGGGCGGGSSPVYAARRFGLSMVCRFVFWPSSWT